jgi:uncharacterized membrane protein YvlD (DUF360 family)
MSEPVSIRGSLRASIGLARDRIRRGPRNLILTWLIQAIVLLALGRVIPGVLVEDLVSALLAAAVIAGLNALVRPIIVLLTLPLTVATFGLLSLIINSSMIVLAAPLVPGVEVNGFLPALALAVVFTVATTIVNVVIAVDEDESFYAELTRRISAGERPADAVRTPGLVVVQVDGLAAPILRNAIRVGTVPRMASWVRSGAYTLSEWECPPPSQTSASQAGILHGNNDDIPAFRWYEKESGRLLVSNRPADATEIERRVSDGAGLLAPGGTSVGNLFTGDAGQNAFVMSRMGNPVGDLDIDAFSLYFVDPAAFIRTIVLSVGEFFKELMEARRQRVANIRPRVHRGITSAFLRAATNVVLRDLNTTFVMRSMSVGVPIIYVDFTDYDEIAHHAGPERLEALRALTGVDQVIAALERASHEAARDYRFVLLSDHGQSQGATFLDRYGQSLEAYIRELMGGEAEVLAATGRSETFGPVNAMLSELSQRPGVAGRATTAALRSRAADDGAVELGREKGGTQAPEDVDLVVCASGNLANVYLTFSTDRLTAPLIEERYPGLLARLTAHPGIGFVMVATPDGTVALGRDGVHHLAGDRIDGTDPLTPFGPHAADHLRRIDAFPNVGDLLVNSVYDADLEEVAAFEELVGSHGGMGGPQTRPFLLHPAELAVDEPLVGAPAVHRQLKRWAERLGVDPTPVRAGRTAEPAVNPRGLAVVTAWQIGLGLLILVLSGLLLLAPVVGLMSDHPVEVGRQGLVVGVIGVALGLLSIAAGYGIWRRRRWAWGVTIVLQAFSILQALLGIASGGLSGLLAPGVLPAIMAVAIFFYLTRPPIAAVFRSDVRREGPPFPAGR